MSDLRRFYFDDGKSRKRWHVEQQGKQQIVRFGRLGGSLQESQKSFPSPAEAKEQTEKLIAKKMREGYVEIDPTRLEIVRAKGMKTATEAQIKSVEKQIGCTLPDEYRRFLLTTNGGHPNPDCVAVPGMAGIDNVGVGALFHLQPSQPGGDELTYELANIGKLLPAGHLPIAGSSDVYTLSLKPKTFGCVYWWFHETEEIDDDGNYLESAGYLLAGSFDEFLTRIAGLFGDEEKSPAEAAAPKGAAGKTSKATLKGLLRLMNHRLTPDKVKEIEQVIAELGDVSGIRDGEWPFNNIDSPAIVRALLEAGLNPENTDDAGHSLLWQCAGCPECVALLLERGVNVNRRSGGDFETALMRAIYCESLPAVQRLLKAGANPTVRLSWDFQEKLKSNAKLRKVIEKAREDWKANKATQKETRSATPVKSAAPAKKKGPQPTLKRLLKLLKHDYIPEEFEELAEIEEVVAGLGDLSGIADGEWPDIDRLENPDLLRCLLDAGLNPDITAKDGSSLLSQCVQSLDCLDLLLERGAAVDRRTSDDDETPLMRAASVSDEECVQRLLNAGADPTLEFTPFAKTMLNMKTKMKALIEAARADWSRKQTKKK
jgi:predicted DNA-binding WGR domain protein